MSPPERPAALTLHLASGNRHKVAELQALADASRSAGSPGGLEVRIASAAEAGGMPEVVEDTGTFAGNAAKKARALKARLPADAWALADDSGICVDALGGEPGVDSAYYAGPGGDPAANLAKLVQVMRGVPRGRRGAHYHCTLYLCGPGGVERAFEGSCTGSLAEETRGTGGFGYDPMFVPDGHTCTMAELPAAEKNRIGHRGRAWARCFDWLAAGRQTVLG